MAVKYWGDTDFCDTLYVTVKKFVEKIEKNLTLSAELFLSKQARFWNSTGTFYLTPDYGSARNKEWLGIPRVKK